MLKQVKSIQLSNWPLHPRKGVFLCV
jgi:hypothetical protein